MVGSQTKDRLCFGVWRRQEGCWYWNSQGLFVFFVVISLISKSSGTGGHRVGSCCGCSGFQVKLDFQLKLKKLKTFNSFTRKLGKKKQRFKLWRKKFLSGLQAVGLDIEDVSLIMMRWQMELTRPQYCRRWLQRQTVTFTSSNSTLLGLCSAPTLRNSI